MRWWIAGLLVWLLGGALASEGQTLLFEVDAPEPQWWAHFGEALARVGDVDGDGVPDLAVGAWAHDVTGPDSQGRVFVFSGASGAHLRTLDDPLPQAGAHFGLTLTGVGDVDGDGVPDLAVGAPDQNVAGQGEAGRVFVFSGASGAHLRTLDDPVPQAGARFGQALAWAGDVDGDGVPDLAVGAPGRDLSGQDEAGEVFVFSGASGQPVLTLTKLSHARFGDALAGVGDVDGDGVPDLAVGAPGQDVAGQEDQGRVFVFSGASGARLQTLDNPVLGQRAHFGLTLAGVGDVDGDGVPDLAVGAPNERYLGRAFVFSLGATP